MTDTRTRKTVKHEGRCAADVSMASGTPEDIVAEERSYTGQFLK